MSVPDQGAVRTEKRIGRLPSPTHIQSWPQVGKASVSSSRRLSGNKGICAPIFRLRRRTQERVEMAWSQESFAHSTVFRIVTFAKVTSCYCVSTETRPGSGLCSFLRWRALRPTERGIAGPAGRVSAFWSGMDALRINHRLFRLLSRQVSFLWAALC